MRLYEISLRIEAKYLQETGYVACEALADAERFLTEKYPGSRIITVREMGHHWIVPPAPPADAIRRDGEDALKRLLDKPRRRGGDRP